MNESFIFYKSWWENLADESQETKTEVINAIMQYVFYGVKPELSHSAKMAFKFIKQDIDRAKEKYDKLREKNRQNGLKGGRPQGNAHKNAL